MARRPRNAPDPDARGGAAVPPRQRADVWLTERGLMPSRARARAEIEAGAVLLDGVVLSKPGQLLTPDAAVTVQSTANPYVSRGGLKLAHGLNAFALSADGLIALDLGASTGGFTQVLREAGAARVYAVDVGHGQLHESLRADAGVVVLEGVNARALTAEHIPEAPDLIVSDVSFISLKLALPPALALAAPGARLVALIKPQFEAGRAQVGKGGVVRDRAIRQAVCDDIARWLDEDQGWTIDGLIPSPIPGPDGNEEFLIAAHRSP